MSHEMLEISNRPLNLMGNDVVSGVLDDYDEDEEEEKKGSNGSLNIRSAYVSRKISCSFLRIS